MKKNPVGHMMTRKENAASFLRRSYILPKLLCLLSAVVIWLVIVNLIPTNEHTKTDQPVEQLQSLSTESLEF